MIKPTIGRIVHFYRRTNFNSHYTVEGPHAALVLAVHGDRCVNVQALDGNGKTSFHSSIALRQPEDPQPQGGQWVEWMPHQVETAATSEAINRSIQSSVDMTLRVGQSNGAAPVTLRGG